MAEAEDQERTSRRSRRRNEARLRGGLACTAIFGILFIVQDGWFWLIPLALAGVLPTIDALTNLNRARGRRRPATPEPVPRQKQVLRVARDHGGRITPALVAVDSSLSLEEAEQALDELVRAGHASMHIDGDGRVLYELREFMPPATQQDGAAPV